LLYGDNNKNKKLSAKDAYNELEIIEIYINNPDNIFALNCLTEINKNISENSKKEKNLNTANNENNLSYQIFPYINLLFNQNFYLQKYKPTPTKYDEFQSKSLLSKSNRSKFNSKFIFSKSITTK
jgi:hypothetical protein